jgi:diguanylate cyclase (GGDEF)-like protein
MLGLHTELIGGKPDTSTTIVNLERENQHLKRRLEALTTQAAKTGSILKRSLKREMNLLEAGSLEELLHLLVHGLADSYDLDSVTVALCDQDHGIRHLLISEGAFRSTIQGVFFVDSLDSLAPQFASFIKPWLGPYKRVDHRLIFLDIKNLSSVALIPLLRHDRLVGSINFGSGNRARFTQQHATDFLQRLGAIASFCLENAINRARLIRTGLTDVLTGWYNRRYLEDRIHGELARAQRNQQPLVCLLLDIDHFKRVNDSHGHLAGDTVLREIAKRVAGKIRTSDVAARFGGDELAVLLPNTNTDEAQHLAERIRETVSLAPIEVQAGLSIDFTLCIGIAGLIPERGTTDFELMRERLLERADAALYRAKSEGRNRVELYRGD